MKVNVYTQHGEFQVFGVNDVLEEDNSIYFRDENQGLIALFNKDSFIGAISHKEDEE